MRLAWLVVVTGCSFTRGAAPGTVDGAGSGSDGGAIDAPGSDGSVAPSCYDVDGVPLHICLAHAPTGTTTISSTETISTTPGEAQCEALAPTSDQACVISGHVITISQGITLAATGATPLVLIGDTITVDGTIDVASHDSGGLAGQVGAFANGPTCTGGAGATGRGGGAGGSNGTKGASGGDESGQGGTHGTAGGMLALGLAGGCPGQPGGTSGGAGGAGGGMAILIATTLTVSSTGQIDASGAGGGGAGLGTTRGGGGGGSGGVIVLQGTSVLIDTGAQVFANGGGGGGGTNNADPGDPGDDPLDPVTLPGGGVSGGAAGDGGAGYYNTHAPTAGMNGTMGSDGGGGGGGGAGIIHIPQGGLVQGGNALSPRAT